MKTMRRWQTLLAAGLLLAATTLTGCQTWVPAIGMTLPSGHYLQHPPQYFPPSPPYPLPRELAYQESVSAQAAGAQGGLVPPPPGPAPVVPPQPLPPPAPPAGPMGPAPMP
jgi:hypothetical protein